MVLVDGLFVGSAFQTEVWISDKAARKLRRFQQEDNNGPAFVAKLEYYAKAGFGAFEHKQGPIRREWSGVYRVGRKDTLFRLIGFYETDERRAFITIDAFTKTGQKPKGPERKRIDEVAAVKSSGNWRKGTDATAHR